MNENLLHLLWRTRRFDAQNLTTTQGENLRIVKPGKLNAHNGPDFLEAEIECAQTNWYGSVEIHVKSSDWLKHGHTIDTNYNNVILHVVYESDCIVYDANKNVIPCLELKNRISMDIIARAEHILNNQNPILCATHLPDVPNLIKHNWLERVFIQRLEAQSLVMKHWASKNRNDWDAVLWQLIFRYALPPANRDYIVQIFESLPFTQIKRIKNNVFAIEALLIGQAGYLEGNFTDAYILALQTEYRYQKQKHNITPFSKQVWQTKSIRDAASICIRLSQLAHLLGRQENIFSDILKAQNMKDFEIIFESKTSEYWFEHNIPDNLTVWRERKLGKATIGIIVANAVLPFLFFYSDIIGDETLKQKSLQIFEALKPEKNSITELWQTLKISAENAAQSQALVHLKKHYCDLKRCFECQLGTYIFTVS